MDDVLLRTSLIWVAYAATIGVLALIAVFVLHVYQDPHGRAASVTLVSVLTITSLLATVLLLPVDIALVSSTNSQSLGIKHGWATPEKVEYITGTIRILYYSLYSLDAVLCFFVVPYVYFWNDVVEADHLADRPARSPFRQMGAAVRQSFYLLLAIAFLFLVGLGVVVFKDVKSGNPVDLDYLKDLFKAGAGQSVLSFTLGFLICIGTVLAAFYLAPGLALMPLSLLDSSRPTSSGITNGPTNIARLEAERDELERLQSDEGDDFSRRNVHRLSEVNRRLRSLNRDQNLAAGTRQRTSSFSRVWVLLENIFRPVKSGIGYLFVLFSFSIWLSILITGIDKLKNSSCGAKCGYVLAHSNIFQPIDRVLVLLSPYFPADYVFFFVLVLFLFLSLVFGAAAMNRTPIQPQVLLLVTGMMAMVVLAINYTAVAMIAPHYASFGSQTYCDRAPTLPGLPPDCSAHPEAVMACSETSKNGYVRVACTPSVSSSIINQTTIRFPVLGVLIFWSHFVVLAVYVVVVVFKFVERSCCRRRAEGIDEDTARFLDSQNWAEESRRGLLSGRDRARAAAYGTASDS